MSIMRRAALALCVCLPHAAAAQGGGPATDSVSGKAALGYLATSGNTESESTNASFSVVYTLPDWRHSFNLSAVGASTNDETTAEAYLFGYEARRSFGEHNFLFTALDWKRDRFSGYAEQVSQTVGYGRRFLDGERHFLDAGLGAGARQSELRDGTEEDDRILRGSVNYRWVMTETTDFEQSIVVESGSTNTMTESRSALRARIIGNIALVLSYRVKHNSAVPAGSAKTDRFSSVALEYAF